MGQIAPRSAQSAAPTATAAATASTSAGSAPANTADPASSSAAASSSSASWQLMPAMAFLDVAAHFLAIIAIAYAGSGTPLSLCCDRGQSLHGPSALCL